MYTNLPGCVLNLGNVPLWPALHAVSIANEVIVLALLLLTTLAVILADGRWEWQAQRGAQARPSRRTNSVFVLRREKTALPPPSIVSRPSVCAATHR